MAAWPREKLPRLLVGVFETCLSSNHFLPPYNRRGGGSRIWPIPPSHIITLSDVMSSRAAVVGGASIPAVQVLPAETAGRFLGEKGDNLLTQSTREGPN